jgi:hypothetical protein
VFESSNYKDKFSGFSAPDNGATTVTMTFDFDQAKINKKKCQLLKVI